jgi:hypothetical protein
MAKSHNYVNSKGEEIDFADSFNVGLINDAIDAATAALDAEPSENVPIPDHASMLAFACGREPWATWLKSGGSLESAHLELSDLMLAVLAQWGQSTPPASEVSDGPSDEQIEQVAQLVYASMRFAVPDIPAIYGLSEWVERGGGPMQVKARKTARAVLARRGNPATLAEPEPGEVAGVAEWLNKRGQMADLGVKDWYFRSATLLQQQAAELATLRITHEVDQGKVKETVDALVKAEAILTDVVEGESPVDCGPSNAHNYFAEQCGHLESGLEKCEELLENIRSVIKRHEIGKHSPSNGLEPVSVSERLPGREDCDNEGRCWWLMKPLAARASPSWVFGLSSTKDGQGGVFFQTHWLPHNAIPLPQNVGVLSSNGEYEAGSMWMGHTRPNSDASRVEQAATRGEG